MIIPLADAYYQSRHPEKICANEKLMTLTAYRMKKEPEVDRPKGNVVPGKALYDQRYADRNAGRGSKQSISE